MSPKIKASAFIDLITYSSSVTPGSSHNHQHVTMGNMTVTHVLHIDHGHHPLQTEAWLASEAGQWFPRFPESYLGSIGDQAPCEPLQLLRPGGSTVTIITNFFQLL